MHSLARNIVSILLFTGTLALAHAAPALTEWYYADALAIPPGTKLEAPINGAHGISLEWMVIFNLGANEAEATVTHYFENKPPVQKTVKLPAHASVSINGHGELPEELQPKLKLYAVRVQSAAPIIVQATRAEQEIGVKKPTMPGRSFLSRLGYAGPLGQRETAWAYADSYIQRNNPNAVETEWVTLFNPGQKDAKIKITFNYAKDPPTSHLHVVPAERVHTLALADLAEARDDQLAGVLVESDVPVVVEQVRRYWYKWHPAPAGTWISTAQPIGGLGLSLPTAP